MQNNYSQWQYQVNNGFSNPFGNAGNINNNHSMGQGYTGFNSFVTKDPLLPPKKTTQNKAKLRVSKISASTDRNPNKRLFRGKYELNATIPVKYNTVDYFMLVENVRINNENALRELKRGKAEDILNQVLDSLEFLSYIHK